MPLVMLAQTQLTGTVVDAKGEPLAGAIVQLRNNGTNKTVGFIRTNIHGQFSIKNTADSYLEVSLLGFRKQRIKSPTVDKPMCIVMEDEAVSLKEVTVKANKVRQNGDTITYNVATFADKNDRSIGDVLARIPGFEVDKQNGEVKYEGKSISKFYIEGLDMLGGKYGVATNSLPQVDVGSVQVMRNHQPIRVLEDFTYTDDAAVNIRMKEGAKSRWVTSLNGGAGISSDTGLWKLEGFGLRLKSDFQTMLTYKSNNIGENINRETTNLFSLDDMDNLADYISLAPPTTPNLTERRTLFNRSHAVTANVMKRINESSQINVQLIYNNNRETANGNRLTELIMPDGIRTVDNSKDYLKKDNELYALVKYEKNSQRHYLKNSLSGDFTWSRQWLNERGTDNHMQFASKPEYDIRDNLYIIHKYGNKLVSFYSNNRIVSRPQSLTVDSLYQRASSQMYSTDTYVMGGMRLGKFNLSLKAGVNAAIHRLESEATGLPDILGLLCGGSRYSFARLYVEPKFVYKTRDIELELTPTTEYLYEKYSEGKGHNKVLFSPDLYVRWYATPRLRISLGGYSAMEASDPTHFHRTLVMQDFQYIRQGWGGYSHGKTRALRSNIVYNDALQGLHTMLTISRSFSTSPYITTRQFVGNYVILSAEEQETKSNSWQATLIASKGINLWNGVVSLRAFYTDNDATMLQDGIPTKFNSKTLNARAGIDLSFYKDMRFRYGLTFSNSRMKMEQSEMSMNIHNWKHDMTVAIPIDRFSLDLTGEYYRNELTDGKYKDFFLADIKAAYKFRHLDISLALNNLLNRNTYSYVTASNLIRTSSINVIRGRELIVSLYYKF